MSKGEEGIHPLLEMKLFENTLKLRVPSGLNWDVHLFIKKNDRDNAE